MSPIAHRGAVAISTSTCFTALALAFLGLRSYTRYFIAGHMFLEDYFAIFAMLCSIGFTVCIAVQAHYGMGRRLATLSPHETENSMKAFWVSLSMYYTTLTMIKVSIILQYKRVFLSKRFQTACWIIMVIVVGLGIWTVFGSILACLPVRAFWTRQPAKCLDQIIMWSTDAAFNIVTDFAIIILPIPAIRRLQLLTPQKHALIAVFAVGGLVCLVSILRFQSLIIMGRSPDPTYTNMPAATWTALEINISIVCACLPGIRPFLSRLFPGVCASSAFDIRLKPTALPKHNHSRRLSQVLNNAIMLKGSRMDTDLESLAGGIEVVTEVYQKSESLEDVVARLAAIKKKKENKAGIKM